MKDLELEVCVFKTAEKNTTAFKTQNIVGLDGLVHQMKMYSDKLLDALILYTNSYVHCRIWIQNHKQYSKYIKHESYCYCFGFHLYSL